MTGPTYEVGHDMVNTALVAAARTSTPWSLAELTRLDAVATDATDLHQPHDLLGTSTC